MTETRIGQAWSSGLKGLGLGQGVAHPAVRFPRASRTEEVGGETSPVRLATSSRPDEGVTRDFGPVICKVTHLATNQVL